MRTPVHPAFAAFLFVLAMSLAARLVVDGLWFDAVAHSDVFRVSLLTQVLTGSLGALLTGGMVLVSGRWALRQTANRPVIMPPDWRGTLADRWLRQPAALHQSVHQVAILAAIGGGLLGVNAWESALAWWHHVPFGEVDPILSYDIGFHVFTLPLFVTARLLLLAGAALATLVAAAVYLLRRAATVVIPTDEDGQPAAPELRMDDGPRRHLAFLATFTVLLYAVGFQLQRYSVLHTHGDLFDGPGYTDVHVLMPLLTLQAIVATLAAGLVFRAIDSGRVGGVLTAITLVVMASVGRSMVPVAVQSLLVAPNELDKEEDFIAAHIQATRRAWGLDKVEERALSGEAELTAADLEDNRATIDGIRLWDHDLLLETFRQMQEIRTYYEFSHVDNDRYVIDGRLRQVMLSPRELLSSSLPEQARTWVNERLVYTHGYGLALGPVNAVSPEGLPYLWVKDLPPVVSHADPLAITRPEIYFGETMPDPVFVRTSTQEFDYPTADDNAYSTYEGKAGVQVGGMARRALISLYMGDLNVLLSSELNAGSRVLLHRDVVSRVQRVAPFLWVDDDPTMAIVDGRLVWILEGYTVSDRYPYSAHRSLRSGPGRVSVNYVHASVKAVVDAYDGDITLYRVDDHDPMLAPWEAAFPSLFRPLSAMPQGVRDHLRYPLGLFELQAELFGTYHMTDTQVFYNREDQWDVPAVPLPAQAAQATPLPGQPRPPTFKRMEPYYTTMRLPGEGVDEFILMLPFTPRDKDNLAAWMVARSDGDLYGGLRVYRFPKDRLVYGPSQVVARIQQNDTISEKLTLWNQQSSQSPVGTLLVIPVEESLLYIQPLYLRADSNAIPELRRVIVGYEDRITMQPTLEEGLRVLFGGGSEPQPVPDADGVIPMRIAPGDVASWAAMGATARDHYQAATKASAEGRWADFGAELEALGRVLMAMEDLEADPSDTVPEAAPEEVPAE